MAMIGRRELPAGPPPAGPSGYLMAAAAMLIVCPAALLGWGAAVLARRYGGIWRLGGIAAASAIFAVAAHEAMLAAYPTNGQLLVAAVTQHRSWGILGAIAGVFVRHLVITAPIGVP